MGSCISSHPARELNPAVSPTATSSIITNAPSDLPTASSTARVPISTSSSSDAESFSNQIHHVVVYMLENRSFDAVLGHLYQPNDAENIQVKLPNATISGKIDKQENAPRFYGLSFPTSSNSTSNHMDTSVAVPARGDFLKQLRASVDKSAKHFQNNDVKSTMWKQAVWPPTDANEPHEHVAAQIYNVNADLYHTIDWRSTPNMGGFANDYPYIKNKKAILQPIYPDLLPVFNAFGTEYAVCDQWFASVPTQTWCNRMFAHAATSRGIWNNGKNRSERDRHMKQLALFPFHTIQTWMDQWHGGVNYRTDESLGPKDLEYSNTGIPLQPQWSWKWYSYVQGLDLVSPAVTIYPRLFGDGQAMRERYCTMEQFHYDAKNGGLPSYSVIEPQYVSLGVNSLHNDMHMGELTDDEHLYVRPTVWLAQKGLLDVYESLFVKASPQKASQTLLIITFDEHGGSYDHIPPPEAMPPHINMEAISSSPAFHFQRFGVRVPCLLISPHIAPRTVLRAVPDVTKTTRDRPPFDHTSLISSIRQRWKISDRTATPPLTRRDQVAPSLWHVGGAVNYDVSRDQQRNALLVKSLRQALSELDHYYSIAQPENFLGTMKLSRLAKEIFSDCLGVIAKPAAELGLTQRGADEAIRPLTLSVKKPERPKNELENLEAQDVDEKSTLGTKATFEVHDTGDRGEVKASIVAKPNVEAKEAEVVAPEANAPEKEWETFTASLSKFLPGDMRFTPRKIASVTAVQAGHAKPVDVQNSAQSSSPPPKNYHN